jgi:hypothetical protein
VTAGWCTNALCPRSAAGEPIERYPGPGEYCPDCGEHLQSEAPATATAAPEKTAQFRPNPTVLLASLAAVLCLAAVFAAVGVRAVPAFAVRVCSSTMTARATREILRAYSAQSSQWPYHYSLTQADGQACDVRFFAAAAGSTPPYAQVIARDGVVVIVNPANPIARLDISQVHDILSGRITDWSQAGGQRGTIIAALPDDASDEAHEVARAVMQGGAVSPNVTRTLNAERIVRFVASPSGLRAIGIVPFSGALPAKVIALGHAPPPSSLSIAAGRYPMTVHILAASDFRSPSRPASELLGFAQSGDADALLARTAFVGKKGL